MKQPVFMVELAGAGGISHYTSALLQFLGRAVNVVLYTGASREPLPDLPGTRVRRIFNGLRTDPLKLLGFLRDVATMKPGVVHFQVSQGAPLVLMLAVGCRLLGTKVVVTAHNVLPHERRAWHGALFRAIYRVSHQVIVHSERCRSDLIALRGRALGNEHVLDHGNYMLLADGSPVDSPSLVGPLHLLFFGFIRHYKGLDLLIDAVSVSVRSGRDITLEIVGKPVERFDAYARQIAELGLDSRVSSTLRYVASTEIADAFRRSDCVVLPYRTASQSGVLQLAYAFGRPVVATAVGGLPEAVEHGRSGLVVENAEVADLAAAITRLADDRALVREMGARAAELAATRFSWAGIATRTLQVYAA